MSNSVLIATDNAAVRAGIRFQLESSGLEVCGEAQDGLDALDKAVELKPDLIVLDLSMPRMNGLEAARELKRICPGVPVILHTIYADAVREGQVLPEGVTAVVGENENLRDRVLQSLQERDSLISSGSQIAVCAKCASERQQTLHAEVAASFPKLKDLGRGPMYFRQDIRVCLDCGHTELVIPPSFLTRLQ
jgi:CheY-like chemotaxis protein